ncbi:MAG: N-acetylglucosamine-6-phosphate deacetylase [Daejeonella sp.]|uniref:N-acetylglucosamine-6-phosphate deacetylase n=1 Tax=Daejeonella sp. TaxID=2805397 RepID=UPI002735AEF1|nr:N-acetylglucosamine-6-phosphate deacetylase [Daejeonella sp.]MDP3467617.1 N-acetylglucosamine-6-phosphate deacetylase [Daejeonella sp.]
MDQALINASIFTGEERLENKALLISNGQIHSITDSNQIPSAFKITDLNGLILAPGLIDLQIYGSGGKLFGALPDEEGLEQMEKDLLAQGTTGFFATSATNSDEVVLKAIDAAKAYRKKAKGNFLGLHLEGPYLNEKRKGAHPEKYIKKGTLAEIKNWVERAEGELKMMTIAPELQDQRLIDYLYSNNIIISAGHSDATYDEAISFLNNPVQAATHLYNAMPPIHHRAAGLVPAIFKLKPYTSIVADGVHVSFPMIELAKRELADRLFLITDAVTETNEGVYQHVFKGDRYTMPDGTLSGSCLSMLKAVENCVLNAEISLEEALRMASTYPARLLGDQSRGLLKNGYRADIIVLNKDLKHHSTYLSGNLN